LALQNAFASDEFGGIQSDHAASVEQALSRTNLYIRGLTQNTTDEDLYSLCEG